MALTRIGPNQSVNLTSNVTGTLPAANGGTGATSFSPGKVLQIQATQGINEFASTSTSFTDVTGVSLTITPAATSSKILLLANLNTYIDTTSSYVALRWERAISGGATTNIGHATYGISFARSAVANDFWSGVGMTYLDTPSTTSEITYQLQGSNAASGGASFQVSPNNSSSSNIMALEIAG